MLIISSREFRDKQAEYLDKVDSGEQVIVQRGKNKAYRLTPVSSDDMYFSPEMLDKLNIAIRQIEEGKTTRIADKNALTVFLDGL
jgi:prevent-host-death family protein